MVSFWPWRSDDSSTASFEKALSSLSTKITNTQAQLDRTRSTARRLKVLWSLYLSFAYLVYAIVLVLVVGWKNLGPWEWTGVAGGPVLIYVTRTGLTEFFNYRVSTLSARLKAQQTERAKTVQKLKDATKYDSTLELLEKYGGEPKRPRGEKESAEVVEDQQSKPPGPGPQKGTPARTGIVPPPTANIPRISTPSTPQPARGALSPSPSSQHPTPRDISAEFAPNAFGPGGPPSPATVMMQNAHYAAMPMPDAESHWYDRIMDLLLGEDETAAKNRIVLICARCRLVNGQAPPGTKRLADIGMWKCMGCGASNGEDDEGKRIIKDVLAHSSTAKSSTEISAGEEFKGDSDDSSDIVQIEKEMAEAEEFREGAVKRRGKGKK